MVEESRLDAFHAHEVLHISSVIAEMFEQKVVEHPYTQADDRLRVAAEDVSTKLYEFYQLVGSQSLP